MANGSFSSAVANGYMTKYAKLVVDCIPKASGEFNQIPVETVKSDRYEWRLKVKGGTSMGNTVENADFQPPDSPTNLTTFSGFTIFHSNHQLSDIAKAVIDGSETNFFNALNFLSEDAMDQALLYREGFLYGNGTGEVGTVASVSGANVRILGYANGRSINPSTLLMDGAVYEVVDSTLTTSRGFFTQVNRNNVPQTSNTSIDVVTGGLPAGTTAGDRIFWVGQGNITSRGRAPQGLGSLIDNSITGTFQGVDMTTSVLGQKWVSSVDSGGGSPRALTPTILMNALQAQAEVYTGRSIDGNVGSNLKWLANPAQALPFYNMFPGSASPNTPFVTRPDDQKMGNMSRTFAGPLGEIKLSFRRECPQSTIYGVDYSNLVNAERIKLDWRDKSIFMLNPNSANSVAQLYGAFQLCVKERRHMVRIDDLSYTIRNGNRG